MVVFNLFIMVFNDLMKVVNDVVYGRLISKNTE